MLEGMLLRIGMMLVRESIFVSCSIFFVYVFYLYPLLIIKDAGGYAVAYWHDVGQVDILLAFLSLFVFLTGFFVFGLFLNNKGLVFSSGKNLLGPVEIDNRMLFLGGLFVVGYFASDFLDPNRALNAYAARRNEMEVGRLSFLISIVFSALKIGLLLSLIEAKKKTLFWILWGMFVIFSITTATGRMSLLTLLSIGMVYLVFRYPIKLVICGAFAFPFIVPFLANMKTIIYEVAYLKQIPDIYSYYTASITWDTIVANFGHPVYSFFSADQVIDIVGYRFFYDVLHGFLFYFKVIGLDFGDSLTYYNTEALLGRRESIIPTGYIAFGYIQMSYLGIFWAGCLYRFVGYLSGKILYFSGLTTPSAFYVFSVMSAFTFYHGEVRVILMTLILPIIVISFFSRLLMRRLVF
eukprot:gnl/TRDRNA2_/TRDRNA2_176255_c2_seq1.p1 gnl/TRDRNA2_/TRDRNA2_176255_c2~~gnl/TRDRNA2_/TRDRNA2_176255_c2_seq1.p1  ORF type:complete len:408 (-),score=-19.17 gnl/TRDRNA2_/TRDRNA2_176255_c2_seq1:21-1244(-)